MGQRLRKVRTVSPHEKDNRRLAEEQIQVKTQKRKERIKKCASEGRMNLREYAVMYCDHCWERCEWDIPLYKKIVYEITNSMVLDNWCCIVLKYSHPLLRPRQRVTPQTCWLLVASEGLGRISRGTGKRTYWGASPSGLWLVAWKQVTWWLPTYKKHIINRHISLDLLPSYTFFFILYSFSVSPKLLSHLSHVKKKILFLIVLYN